VASPERWEYSDYREWVSENLSVHPAIRKVRDAHFLNGRDYMQFVIDRAEELRIRGEVEKKLFGLPGRSPSSP
jgi:lysine/ornithine N-monooxygenase